MKRKLLFLSIALALLGCSSYKAPRVYNFQNYYDYPLPFEYVWNKIIQFFGETGIQIKNIDKSSGFIATESVSFSGALGEYLDCGKPEKSLFGYGEFQSPYGFFNILVTKLSQNSTRVQIKTFYKVYYVIYLYRDNRFVKYDEMILNCNSTGKLETILLSYIAK